MKPRKWRKPHGQYIEHWARLRVRFQEVDALRIVWHGHYLTYFEEARVALGREYGINYNDFVEAGLLTPVVHISCDFVRPAEFHDELEVLARLYKRDSAKLEYYFEVHRPSDQALLATGQSIHAFSGTDSKLRLTLPDFMRDWYARWESEMVSDDA